MAGDLKDAEGEKERKEKAGVKEEGETRKRKL